jgi:hypothetical protein
MRRPTDGGKGMSHDGYSTRLERVLGVPLAPHAIRQWPQSGELIGGRDRIAEVEAHFVDLRLAVGRRHVWESGVVVEWSTDYGDGRVYRNVSIAEVEAGQAVRMTDYWGEPFAPPPWRQGMTDRLPISDDTGWPSGAALTTD